MVKFTIDQIKKSMENALNIRNISVIAHVDHGKSTLTDSLVAKAGLISEENMGDVRFTDSVRADQVQRGITIKSTSVSLYYERKEIEDKKEGEKEVYLINLIDSPGHVDFSSEVTAALRVTDGALVVVDCIEGVCVQTETVLRQAINERIRPILFLNKLDRIFLELQSSNEECYKSLRNSIESVNVICSTYKDEKLGNIELIPSRGNVGFGSGLQAWGFTLETFAKMYSGKFGMSKKLLMNKLWGENYWDNKNNIWINKCINDKNGKQLERSFCQFILTPIKILFNSIMNEKLLIYESIINNLNIKLKKEDYKLKPKDLLKLIMRSWLSAGECLFNMIIDYLPSPIIAQQYRIENLYSGPLDTEEAYSIRTCNIKGPMTMYISKMIPTLQKGRFVAFGRVFSGIVKTGHDIHIFGPEYEHGNKKDLYIDKIKGILLMMGKQNEIISDCPCGNICGVIGIDDYLLKSGTITSSLNCYPFHTMKFSVSAVVQIAVEPKNASDLPLLIEGLKKLSKSDPLVKIINTKSGQHIISGAGSLHLEICLKDLKDDYMKGNEIKISNPMVSFCETISCKSGEDNNNNYPNICISKSPNKHNRLYVSSLPIENNNLILSMEKQEIKYENFNDNIKNFAKLMNEYYQYDLNEAKKIWTFGCPPESIANILIDNTKGVQYLNEVKDHIIGAFMNVTSCGVLCEENMRGIQFKIEDAKLHNDRTHRNQGQLYQCATRVFYACEIASQPKIVEPMYLVDIQVNKDNINNVYQTINNKRGKIENVIDKHPLINIKAFLPVLESFDFIEILRKNTGGKAFPQMTFSHWSIIDNNPFLNGTLSNQICLDIRKRKGLKLELPIFNHFFDKI